MLDLPSAKLFVVAPAAVADRALCLPGSLVGMDEKELSMLT
jgi:hypothetical protein